MEVPDFATESLSPVLDAETTFDPGAKMATHFPKFEKEDLASKSVVEPTAIAPVPTAGEIPHASTWLFPADTTTITPRSLHLVIASSRALLSPPPLMLMLITMG
jgi:hypothetical protein